MFIPPINLGGWKPSPATMSEWIYQIWKYLQENPIATQDQIKQYIEEQIGDDIAEKLPDILPEELDAYLEEHPINFPVDSVNGKLGAVLLELADIVQSDSMLPVVSLANDEADQVTLVNAFIDGARICVIDEESVSVMLPTYGLDGGVTAITLLPMSTGSGSGDFSPITLSIGSSGNKTLNAGGAVAFTLAEIGAISTAQMTTLSNRVTAVETLFNNLLGVGAIYITKSAAFNPNGVFPGTWNRLEHAFIYGADSDDTISDTIQGSETVTLALNQIPSHTHTVYRVQHTLQSGGSSMYTAGTSANTSANTPTGSAGGSGGVTQPHNNMPPYLLRYIWERTA